MSILGNRVVRVEDPRFLRGEVLLHDGPRLVVVPPQLENGGKAEGDGEQARCLHAPGELVGAPVRRLRRRVAEAACRRQRLREHGLNGQLVPATLVRIGDAREHLMCLLESGDRLARSAPSQGVGS